ncbi:OLC1v1014119C1 [Oldenlandia corymbosa var. corymbosa]|uniref:OLC1v1014119C1 n=1 Tax=Oldenlandia corymbosa var. corymbosa TaxID=529605 RepID=A0AAV1E223_OLDCO|nr:OLC1v1014119C1 [Oldenlandia corymbosa var. corymbosa]
MPMVTPENSWFGETSRYGRSRNLNLNHSQNQREPISETDRIPSILNSKSTISSLLFPTAENPTTQNKKKNFSSASFRGLGCTASSQVSVPAVIRTSADWETKKVKKKKQNSKKNQGLLNAPPTAVAMGGITASSSSSSATTSVPSTNNGSINSLSLSLTSSCVAVPDVWCGPGMGLTTDAASVDCVVSRRPLSGRGKVDGEKMSHRERPSYSARRMVTQEDIPFLDSDASFSVPRSRIDSFGSRHHRHTRHGFPEGLAEIVMLQNNLMMGGRYDGHDRYRDWRLDVDHMSYEVRRFLMISFSNFGLFTSCRRCS